MRLCGLVAALRPRRVAPSGDLPEPAAPATRAELLAQLPCAPRHLRTREFALVRTDRATIEHYAAVWDLMYALAGTDGARRSRAEGLLPSLPLASLALLASILPGDPSSARPVVEEMKRRGIPLELREWLFGRAD